MAGVKKSGTARTATKAAKAAKKHRTEGTRGTKGTKGTKALKARKAPRALKTPRARTASKTPKAPERTILRIRELDPYRKCGPGTSVERLIRVDEEVAGRREAHLVYFDRHGWYCEHGRTCHAVKHARKGV